MRIGVIGFGTFVYDRFLNTFSNQYYIDTEDPYYDLVNKVTLLPKDGGVTNITGALDRAIEIILEGGVTLRSSVPKKVLLITDGSPNVCAPSVSTQDCAANNYAIAKQEALDKSIILKNAGVELIVIGIIGSTLTETIDYLTDLASPNKIYIANTFEQFAQIIPDVAGETVCTTLAPPLADPPPTLMSIDLISEPEGIAILTGTLPDVYYAPGDELQLTANLPIGYTFNQWYYVNQFTNVNVHKALTRNFTLIVPSLTADKLTGGDTLVMIAKYIPNGILTSDCGITVYGGAGAFTYQYDLDPAGGIVLFLFDANAEVDKLEIIHNGVKKATSGMTVPNEGPFENLDDINADQFIGWDKGTPPTRLAQFIYETGITEITSVDQQLVWWVYTPADYALNNRVNARMFGSIGTVWNLTKLCPTQPVQEPGQKTMINILNYSFTDGNNSTETELFVEYVEDGISKTYNSVVDSGDSDTAGLIFADVDSLVSIVVTGTLIQGNQLPITELSVDQLQPTYLNIYNVSDPTSLQSYSFNVAENIPQYRIISTTNVYSIT